MNAAVEISFHTCKNTKKYTTGNPRSTQAVNHCCLPDNPGCSALLSLSLSFSHFSACLYLSASLHCNHCLSFTSAPTSISMHLFVFPVSLLLFLSPSLPLALHPSPYLLLLSISISILSHSLLHSKHYQPVIMKAFCSVNWLRNQRAIF